MGQKYFLMLKMLSEKMRNEKIALTIHNRFFCTMMKKSMSESFSITPLDKEPDTHTQRMNGINFNTQVTRTAMGYMYHASASAFIRFRTLGRRGSKP